MRTEAGGRTCEGLEVWEEAGLELELLSEASERVATGALWDVAYHAHPLAQQLLEVLHTTPVQLMRYVFTPE